MICSFNFLTLLAVCLNISTVINIKILTNSNQQIQSYKLTSHIAAFLSVVLITEMLEICIQTSYDQNIQLILKSYLPVVYGTPLRCKSKDWLARNQDNVSKWNEISTSRLLFPWASSIKIQLSMSVWYKAAIIIISSKCNLFSPWYSWTIGHLTINNNRALSLCLDCRIKTSNHNIFFFIKQNVCIQTVHCFLKKHFFLNTCYIF